MYGTEGLVVLGRLLIKKGIITKEEIDEELAEIYKGKVEKLHEGEKVILKSQKTIKETAKEVVELITKELKIRKVDMNYKDEKGRD